MAPRTPIEEVLAGIWAEVLGLERVGMSDHFFDLGGHSLLATQVMSRLRGAFGVEMPLRDLFAAPRLADLAARVEAVRRIGTIPPAPPLVPVPREGSLPLSFAQQRLWFIDQLEPGSPLYNIPVALRVEGPLDSSVVMLALGEIMRRHEALRTVFAATEGSPVQVIQPAGPFRLTVVDLSGLPEGAREALAFTLADEEAVRPFSLTCGPLLRGVLLRLAERDHVVAMTMHHIASDGWSMGILVREVAALYPAFAQGQPSPLPELPVQYADFAVWQSSWLQGEILEQELAWWRRQLAGLPPLLELPTDRPRPAVQSYHGATRPVRLQAELTRKLQALGRREGATLFMVLLAGFQTLLARTSGQDDLAVGSPVAGRNRIETEGLIGFFVNTLVLRGGLAGNPTFRELLGRVRETALAAYMHQDLPFEKLVEELAPERSLAHAPLFQVMLVLQNAPGKSLEIRDLRLRPVNVTGTTAKLDLTLSLEELEGGLAGDVEHATDLFDTATIDRWGGHFERLLAAAVEMPELAAAELPLLSAAERHQLLREWSDTAASFPQEATIHGLFAEQARLRPGAVAVEHAGEKLTWGELRRRARRLARRLVARGLQSEERVAVLAERSPDLIATLLGVLEAGGAYLPLDPADPPERLSWMLRDAGASLLVAQETPPFELPVELRLVMPGGEEPEVDLPQVPAAALAYVMYTSGSTGKPKGVAVTHRNVVRLVRGAGYADLGPGQTWLQYAPVSFDASTLEIWAPLLNGGRLVLFPGRIASLDDLARVVEDHGVTSAWLTAGLFHELVDGRLDGLQPLSQLLAGGDVVSPEHARRALAAHPGLTLIDGYGPTEGTTFTCCHRLTAAHQVGESVPIGRPIANAQAYVLDEHLATVPPGVRGELYVGGEGLARGYLDRPDLTAEHFVPDVLAEAGGRLYRTGDVVRRRADGTLEFLGRIDHQVKLRGFRIEPGEIEAVLASLPGVREAVVMVREERSAGGQDGRRLVAYVTGGVAADGLRAALQERLPAYMVPADFVTLEVLPLTANGKVDRQALSRQGLPARGRPAGREPVPPRTVTELVLAQAFEELLGVPVGAEDDFFELGGHSLLSVRLMARIRLRFGLDLPLAELFTHSTVAALALRLDAEGGTSWAPLVPIQPLGTRTPLLCVHPVGGEILCYYRLARLLGTDRPFYGLQARPLNDEAEALQTIEEMATEYLEAVRILQPTGPYLLAGHSFGGIVAFEMARQLAGTGEEVALLALLDTGLPPGDEAAEVDTADMIAGILRQRSPGRTSVLDPDALRELPLDGQLARALEILRSMQAVGPEVDIPLLRRFVLRSSFGMASARRYKASTYPGRITLFRASDVDPADLRDMAPQNRQLFEDPALGWGTVAAGGVEIHAVPGDHNTIVEAPHVETLAEILGACIARIERGLTTWKDRCGAA